MDHSKVYQKIIDRAKLRGLDKSKHDGYYEIHHILPKCMGGTDNCDNLVMLTAKEHFISHLLLTKIYPNEKGLSLAAYRLVYGNSEFKDNLKVTSKTIEKIKEQAIESLKYYGEMRVHGENERRIISEKAKARWEGYRKDVKTLNKIKHNIKIKTQEAMLDPVIREKTRINKGSVWYTNIFTGESIHWYPGMDVPASTVWYKGRPKFKESTRKKISESLKNTCYCYNDDLKMNKRFDKDNIPDGWKRGRKIEYSRK